jgi:ketosteroid isomerase-like protein
VLEADALALVERYDAAWIRKDWPTLEKVLAPDYVYFSSKGDVSNRTATKAMVTSPGYRLDRGDRGERKAYRSGSTVVVGSHWTGTGIFDGNPFTDDQRCSVVVAFADGKGRVLSEHCTNVPAAAGVVPANAP